MSEHASIEHNIARIKEQMAHACERAGRKADDVQLEMAVKYQPLEAMMRALSTGEVFMGHNIIQQLVAAEEGLKAANAPRHRTHVIGHVQKNKLRKALRYSQCIETVDDFSTAERIDSIVGQMREAGEREGAFDVMIQVNSSGADSQFGVPLERAYELIYAVNECENVNIIGLMTIGAHTDNVSDISASFERVRLLRDELNQDGLTSIRELSMGMTGDMDIAIAEGSTIIRVGTAIFGPRPVKIRAGQG